MARQVGPARQHLGRRRPAGPKGLALDLRPTVPFEAFLADAHAITQGGVVLEGDIKEVRLGIDDDGAGLLVMDVVHELLAPNRIDPVHVGATIYIAIVFRRTGKISGFVILLGESP